MVEIRISSEAESELDEIWLYLARTTDNQEIASRVIDDITGHFWLLARHPYLGRRRDDDLKPGLRSLVVDEYVVTYRIETESAVLILHVLHGRRDIESLFRS